jgi:hypothetical protein
MQHKTSATIARLLREGYELTREWDNGEAGDRNISVCELQREGSPTLVYVCDVGAALLSDYDFDGAIVAVNEFSTRC